MHNQSTAKKWECLVDGRAKLLQYEDKTGVRFIAQFSQIIGYAKALLFSNYHQLRFYYFAPGLKQWFNVSLYRDNRIYTRIRLEKTVLPFGITARQLDVLTLLSCGLSNEEIAQKLYISFRTVEKHIEHLFEKLDTDSRTALVALALTQGLCRLPMPAALPNAVLATAEVENIAVRLTETSELAAPALNLSSSAPLVIGVPYVERGKGEADGLAMVNGTKLAIEKINRRGGINGRLLQLVTAGFQAENRQSILSAYRFLFEHKVNAISAAYACYSPETQEIVATEGIPYLHSATREKSVRSVRRSPSLGNIFQTCASDINYGLGLERFILSNQHRHPLLRYNKCVAVIGFNGQDIDLGIERLDLIVRNHWKIEFLAIDDSAGADWPSLIKRLHRISPSVIVLASYFVEDMVRFHRHFCQNPLNAIIYGIYSPSAVQFQQELGELCEGVVWATTNGLMMTPEGQSFCRSYQSAFQQLSGYSQASLAYDRLMILANTWKQSFYPHNRKEVLRGLRTLVNQGVNGAYYLGNSGQVGLSYPDDTQELSISQAHLIFQIQQGKHLVIDPPVFAQSALRNPYWFI